MSGIAVTTGLCLMACTLVQRAAALAGYAAVIRGGDGLEDGGLFLPHGRYGHYWCEVSSGGEHYVVDITADQFGCAPVIVRPAYAPDWPRYVPGDQVLVDSHVAELLEDYAKSAAQ
ncbi:hypothetical protein C1N62_21860 (plasmid) [Nissabacter sp. SGAir0207]|nr:hypothetical protein C1N62_21860 [Nissabacter sp. SGAir0207]